MGSQGATKTLCYVFVSVVENHSTVLKNSFYYFVQTGADCSPHYLAGGHRECLCRNVHCSLSGREIQRHLQL